MEELEARLARLTRSAASDAGEKLQELADLPDDARLTATLLTWILKPQWPGGSARAGWTLVFARLVALRDPRAVAPLRAAAAELPLFLGAKHRDWIRAQLTETADALEKACQGVKAPRGELAFTRPAPKDATAKTLRLVEQVFAAPDDDAIRLVVSDALQEAGDPWGEFIALQFRDATGKATDAERARMNGLLIKHAPLFGGPIAHVCTKDAWRFEKGFLVEASLNRSMVSRLHWDAAARAPHWATVRKVRMGHDVPRYFVTDWAQNPASRAVRQILVGRHPPALEIVREAGAWRVVVNRAAAAAANGKILEAFNKGLTSAGESMIDRE